MSPAKVTLSAKELELVMDTGWILTKNAIIQKVYALFGEVSNAYAAALDSYAMADKELILSLSPKISKGEQYEGLPWVMLDQPRYYKKEDSFGIRSFFWWGNGFSITLQLTGRYHQLYAAGISNYFRNNPECAKDWLTGIGVDQWEHHFREDNYQPVGISQWAMNDHPFIKLTKRFPFSEWDKMEELLRDGFLEILKMLEK